ncbi:hybrid sensor histidine kinase/response regulator [Corticibacter populi]|uniref:histidine kinase n=1 Tax=Corticibacter populi TaxID=1550736 RepID=A0A3M6QMF4_9BURK|nr:hybrid sensor histidine kinase/response regulator [Corticibacter populi]RMX04234.1 hybrid sensor histidine kinase/response regulator [Corticibacter populi]RZS33270.1 signal transduction histidine kinase [Corticibacter populi]
MPLAESPLPRLLRATGAAPGVLAVTLLTGWFTHAQLRQMEQAFYAGNQAVAQQIATAADLSLYAGDTASLHALASGMVAAQLAQRVEISNHAGIFVHAGTLPDMTASLAVATAPVRLARIIYLSDYPDATETASASASAQSEPLGIVRIYRATAPYRQARLHALLQSLLPGSVCVLLIVLLTGRATRGQQRLLGRIHATLARLQPDPPHARDAEPERQSPDLALLAAEADRLAADLQERAAEASRQNRQAREEALHSITRMEQASRARARFLASASHDLRQPLHAMGLFIDGLRAADLPEQRPALAHLQEGIDIMGLLLDDLLDISRLDAHVLKPSHAPLRLDTLFARIDAMHGARAAGQRIRLAWRGGDRTVLGDHMLLARMLGNMVMNAIQHSRGTVILVTARRAPCTADGTPCVRVQVRDNGQGIAPLHHDRIFEEFFQVANAGRDARKGFGLGLSICARIARVLGTSIQVRSGLQCGSAFSFLLPCAPPGAIPPPSVAPPVPPGVPLDGLNCLVIDDDAAIREASAMLLRQWGCRVDLAAQRQEGLWWLGSPDRRYDVILCDLQLQEVQDGLSILEAARLHQPRAMQVLVSGATAPDVLRQLREAGVMLLTKPVAPARLRTLLAQAARRRGMASGA